jgi:4-amino-4-deoxy-L-arabinose transferase-like glycosyltransferase
VKPHSAVTATGTGKRTTQEQSSRVVHFVGSAVDRWGLLAAAVSAVLIGVVLRLARLGEKVLSFDEAYTVATAQRSFLDMLGTFRFEANGTLYAVLLWPLLRISESEAAVRTPAVIAGLATIPAVYWTGRVLVEKRAALIAAALVAISPALIGWSVWGRSYALAILFAVLSFGCLGRALGEPAAAGLWRWLCVLSVLAVAYSSVLAAVTLLPVLAVAVALRVREEPARWGWARPSLALAAGLLPLGVALYLESTYRDPLAWLWKPDLALVRRVGGELAAGPAYFGEAGPGLAGAILAILVAIVAAGLVVSWRRRGRPSWQMGVLLGWMLFPPVLLFVASQVRPMFWGRYLGIAVPALALLIAALLVRMPRRLGAVYGVVLGTLLLSASLVTSAPFNDFRAAATWVEARRSPADPLVVYPVEQLPALSYYARTLRVDGLVPVEEWNDTRLPAGVRGYRRDYDWGDSPVGPPTDSELTRLASGTGSFLVLIYPNLTAQLGVSWAEARGCDVEWAQFVGLSAVSFSACRAGD